MIASPPSRQELLRLNEELTRRLQEAEEALEAIRQGAVDAIVVESDHGVNVFSLSGAERVYRLFVETMNDAALNVTPDGRVLFSNGRLCEWLGVALEQVLGRPLEHVVAPESLETLERLLLDAAAWPARARIVFQANGRRIPVHASAASINQTDGPSICLVATDFSELENRTENLRQRNAQLRALAGELTVAEERERRRVAAVLHDDLQQQLAAARARLELLSRQPQAAPVQAELVKGIALIAEGLEVSRTLTGELSPPVLRHADLSAALKWLGRFYFDKHALTVEVDAGRIDVAAEDLRYALFRAVRELLFNIVKHAGTDHARVEVSEREDGWLRIVVSDEGKGFDLNEVRQRETAGVAFGLFNIRERLDLLGGKLEMTSAPGQGSLFTIVAPLAWSPAADRTTT